MTTADSSSEESLGSRARRELILYTIALACGLFLMPLLIWTVGNRLLGPYVHGQDPKASPLALFADYFAGLGHGYLAFWTVALGPVVLLAVVRLLVTALR